jgi:hypothetical protein
MIASRLSITEHIGYITDMFGILKGLRRLPRFCREQALKVPVG